MRDEKKIRAWILENDPKGQEFLDRLDAACAQIRSRPPLTPEQVKAFAEAEEGCPYCGRVVLCGPPCCDEAVKRIEFDKLRPILINQARKASRRVWKRAHIRFTKDIT